MQNLTPQPVIFVGVVDRFIERQENQPYPMGNTDFLGVGLIKTYVVYPQPCKSLSFFFLAHYSIIDDFNNGEAELKIELPDGREFINCRVEIGINPNESGEIPNFGTFEFSDWYPFNITGFDGLIPFPGIYPVYYLHKGVKHKISDLCFYYEPTPAFTADELYGLKSRLLSYQAIKIALGCDTCDDKIEAYTSIKRDLKLEKEGALWPSDLPDNFSCKCGKVSHDLRYYKESLHGLLRSMFAKSDFDGSSVEYERIYSHKKIHQIVTKFIQLLENEKSENKIQKFIEENPVLLSPFNAIKLFYKPSILGKYETDFVILDAQRNLIFIEIEKPTLKLFQKNGHARAELTHAYEQVSDWLLEYKTSSKEILERMGLEEHEVHAVKGYVIAGVLNEDEKEKYRKHQQKNEGKNIQFMTFDSLASSVLNLSREVV